jgi:site-specific DNA recombinase
MTLRTCGKAEHYCYYTCCTKARKATTGCGGRTVPMHKLDSLVVDYLEQRLLDPERLNEILAALLKRRQSQGDRHMDRIAQLKCQAADADSKLTRL